MSIRRIGARWFAVAMIVCLFTGGSVAPRVEMPTAVNVITTPKLKIQTSQKPKIDKKPTSALVCLAQNLYFEAHQEPPEALQAIAATVFHRMADRRGSVCGEVYRYRQYSWTLDRGKWSRKPPALYTKLAAQFLDEREWLKDMFPVTHFHRWDIKPKWASKMTYVATYGQHVFYSSGL